MEEGSLLSEALQQDNSLSNSIQIDVYPLHFDGANPSEWIRLAHLCNEINHYLQTTTSSSSSCDKYPWLVGGDGPVFGVHRNNSNNEETGCNNIPCLRTRLRYEFSVADEWQLIALMIEFSAQDQYHNEIAIECWDLDDGQILLIQICDYLPAWVDQIGPANCRHRCWIQNGQVHLIQPIIMNSNNGDVVQAESASSSLSLTEALRLLESGDDDSLIVSSDERYTTCVLETVPGFSDNNNNNDDDRTKAPRYHKAALVLPRSVVRMLEQRPDLIDAACFAFVVSHPSESPAILARNNNNNTYEDWVWTTQSMGRPQYAALRSLTTKHYPTEDAIPKQYQSIEVRKLARQCRIEGTPHLRYALQVGLRIVAGLDILRRQTTSTPSSKNKTIPVLPTIGSLKERRIMFWRSIMQQQSSTKSDSTDNSSSWLIDAWEAGPNHAAVDLTPILESPIFDMEVASTITPLSNPETAIAQQIEGLLKNESLPIKRNLGVPAPCDVDDEAWMSMPNESQVLGRNTGETREKAVSVPVVAESKQESESETRVVDQVLGGLQSFVSGTASLNGVAHHRPAATSAAPLERPIRINPKRFLNLLHYTLKHDVAADSFPAFEVEEEEEEEDPFFSNEDYDMGETTATTDNEMLDVMASMDSELREKLQNGEEGPSDDDGEMEAVASLLKSLEAGGGAPGPLQNMLREMGIEPPDVEFEGGNRDSSMP